MALITREQILGQNDIQIRSIHVPTWGADIFIRQLTRGEQDSYMRRQFGNARLMQSKGKDRSEFESFNIYGHDSFLCVCGICTEQGERIFSDKDIAALKEKNGEAIGFIAREIIRWSGMEEDVKVAEEVKNSLETQS